MKPESGKSTKMPRKTSQPPSWLKIVKTASAAFTTAAQVLEDIPVPAAQTSFRGAGWRITVQLTSHTVLFGSAPADPLRLQGDTPTAPQDRSTAPGFPPDSLRQEDYWGSAQKGLNQPVLVLLSQPAALRRLTGPQDDLPAAVRLIHDWLQRPATDQPSAIYHDLAGPASPAAWTAGFELLMGQDPDWSALFERFNRLPGRPAAAITGILDLLNSTALAQARQDLTELANRLLAAFAAEDHPAALSAYLVWFEANAEETWEDNPSMRAQVLTRARQVTGLTFSGAFSHQWLEQVRSYADSLARAAE